MVITNLMQMGNNIYEFRKIRGITQAEAAEESGLSERTYAMMERGYLNTRVLTLLKVCDALEVTPNDLLTVEDFDFYTEKTILERLGKCDPMEHRKILRMISAYLDACGK